MKNSFKIGLGIFMLLFSCVLVSCEENNNDPVGEVKQIKLQNSTTLGSYLVDKNNRTLYYFSNDFNGQNNCPTGNCENAWPYFNIDNLTADQLSDGLSLTVFTTITAANSKKQLTYRGWPLYYFNQDEGVQGANKGISFPEVAVWLVLQKDMPAATP